MCVHTPKPPKVEPIPERQPVLLPDAGYTAAGRPDRSYRRLTPSMMIFANRSGALGAPSVATPLGTRGM